MVLWAPASNRTVDLMDLAYFEVRMITRAKGIECEGIMVGWA